MQDAINEFKGTSEEVRYVLVRILHVMYMPNITHELQCAAHKKSSNNANVNKQVRYSLALMVLPYKLSISLHV